MYPQSPHLRYVYLEDTWVIVAEKRNVRPQSFRLHTSSLISSDPCPFEPGREHLTPGEVFAIREAGTPPNGPGWRVRVFPNKFPALMPQTPPAVEVLAEPFYITQSGFGFHEVIVETPKHHHHAYHWDSTTWEEVLWAWRERYRQLSRESRIVYIQVFKNHGPRAGASLEHPHSQLIALPQIPQAVLRRLQQMQRYYQQHQRCYLCEEQHREGQPSVRMVYQNPAFVVYCPFASRVSGEMRIVPRFHQSAFRQLADEYLMALGEALQSAFHALKSTFGEVDFNLLLHTAPLREPFPEGPSLADYAHWYLEILPRTGFLAGFEWATGWYINALSPEQVAAQFRQALHS